MATVSCIPSLNPSGILRHGYTRPIKAVRFGRTIRIPKDQFASLGAQ